MADTARHGINQQRNHLQTPEATVTTTTQNYETQPERYDNYNNKTTAIAIAIAVAAVLPLPLITIAASLPQPQAASRHAQPLTEDAQPRKNKAKQKMPDMSRHGHKRART